MKELLKNCQNEKGLLKENFLKEFKKDTFSDFNLIIGKNGSGKTRMLRFLKDVALKRGNCNVIFLDCAESTINVGEDIASTDENNAGETNTVSAEEKGANADADSEKISYNLIFKEALSGEALGNLFSDIKRGLADLISTLEGMSREPQFSRRAKDLIRDMNEYLKKMLERELYIKENTICIRNPNSAADTDEIRDLKTEIGVMSPGERNIIILSLALLCINISVNKPSLLLIDEIETHLHPAVLQELLKMLKTNLKETDCCVFIATHSLFLLPEFEFEEICYFEQGQMKKHDGSVYRDILSNMVYGNNNNRSISELLISVDSWSYAEFMAECFLPPTVSEKVNPKDPQYRKMNRIIDNLLEQNGGEKLEILDFGAGNARIGMCMKADYSSENKKKLPLVVYHVYDKYRITEQFKSGEFVFGNKYETKEAVETQKGKMDIVLLYNVLHEVGIDEWCDELNLALSLLNENGVLIFSERKTLSIGEKPYGKSGYLILGDKEIQILFSGMDVQEIEIENDTRRNTWGFAVFNKNRKKVIMDNVEKTLESLETSTKEMIDRYFGQERVERFKARDYAFYCQQFFNVQVARKILEEVRIPDMKMQFILEGKYPDAEKIRLLKLRAEIDDGEGRKCKKWLDENPR